MIDISPIPYSAPLPALEKIQRDRRQPRRESRPEPEEERRAPENPDDPPHIDEYA